MQAVTIDASGSSPGLRDDLPDPEPLPNQVVVRVKASSVNPVDAAIAAGMLEGMIEHVFPVTLGRDYAGVVERTGDAVTRFSEGDEVFGFLPFADPAVHAGTWAERVVVPEDRAICRAPGTLDLETAAAAPLAAITAMTGIDALGAGEGDVLLIVGATGGVGSFAVQLARAAGAIVVAPARSEDEAYLRDLGVSAVVPRDGDVAAAVREGHPDGADALLDLVSHEPGVYDAALKHGARVASPNSAAGDGPGRVDIMGDPSFANLDRLAGLLDNGTLRVPVQESYEIESAAEALRALGEQHTRGKLALTLG